jgi:hypothetical protein
VLKVDQRDWELLNEQMRRFSPPPDNGIMGLTVAVVFLAGLALGGILFTHESSPMQPAWNNTKVATYLSN